ncbi:MULTISPECIES: substrate-binding periplasmic protein [Vibrio]|uniref:Amino acid ABC transporter substrate-binding protein n=1 Tax=Vibrio bivalvicida TaxID=1276888 RepID=A0A177Y5Z7_9VIBR|nr:MULTISPECIES: transporter substrate-binding domain-containing protein [Vibrio]KLN64538.1 amino acid ABC transporter substrate-binding protein [Vibrio sp. VPAP30]OAJ96262.1 amino acid ABC transporter substrate-binding protein [Vibrio bivalvicida]
MRLLILFLLSYGSFLQVSHSVELNELSYLTEQYPPYNFDQGEGVEGIAIDVLRSASEQAKSQVKLESIQVQPWPRAYRSALIKPDTVLFSTTRTQLREHIFQWAGPISKTRIVVLAKKSRNITVSQPMALAQYRIGVIRDDVGEQLLLELGVPRDSMVESSVPETLANQFVKDRIDLWAYEENVAKWWLKRGGYNTDEYEAVYVLSEGDLYFAFNLETNSDLVQQLQQGIDTIKQTIGESGRTLYQEIVANYK